MLPQMHIATRPLFMRICLLVGGGQLRTDLGTAGVRPELKTRRTLQLTRVVAGVPKQPYGLRCVDSKSVAILISTPIEWLSKSWLFC
jgi:hypothetical protein